MNTILSKLVSLTPIVVIIIILAYVAEELLESRVSELASDLVYPAAGLLILGILWKYLVPVIQAHLTREERSRIDELSQKD